MGDVILRDVIMGDVILGDVIMGIHGLHAMSISKNSGDGNDILSGK